MQIWKKITSLIALSVLLAACGGGGGGSGSPCAAAGGCGGTTSSSSSSSSSSSGAGGIANQITLVTDNAAILTNGTDRVKVRAVVQNANNAAAVGTVVNFAVTSGGGTLSSASATANAEGIAEVTYHTDTNKSNRAVVIVGTIAGTSASASTSLAASGTAVAIGGLNATVIGQPLTLTVSLTDAKPNPIANQAVSLALSSGAGSLSTATVTTDSQGKATFTYTPPASGSTTAVISASALGASTTASINVAGIAFSFTSSGSSNGELAVNTCSPLPLTAQVTGASGPLIFTTSIGQLYTNSACSGTGASVVSVPLSGNSASVWIRASNTGSATISAITAGATASTSTSLQFISTIPASMTLSASPSTVSATSQSTITAFVKDASGNPVTGQTVFFSIPGGGNISAFATTGLNGVASATFTAGATLTGLNGIPVQATITSPLITATADLTIAGQGVTVDIGFDNLLEKVGTPPIYRKVFVITVLDSNRSPVSGQTVTMNLNVNGYNKGYYVFPTGGTKWAQVVTTATIANPFCLNEDTNNNGILDPSETDINGNGLPDPVTGVIVKRQDNTASGSSFTVTTGADGKAMVVLEYPQNQATWLQVTLAATATVQGRNSRAQTTLLLPGAVGDVTDQNTPPPFETSPYGISSSCTNTL